MTLEVMVDYAARGFSERQPGTAYTLSRDVVRGFRQAVTNNQSALAMTYLQHIIDALLEAADTSSLEARIEALEAAASTATSRKTTKVSTANEQHPADQ